jgi:hypothetical protein
MNTPLQTCWKPSETYQPRPLRFLEVRHVDGWHLKLYAIVYGDAPLEMTTYEEAFPQAWYSLPRPAQTELRPGVGFVIMHQGRGMHYLLVCWWDNENELFERVFVRRLGLGESWRPATAGETACVWDLQVIGFERQAYVDTILSPAEGADVAGYLARRLEMRGGEEPTSAGQLMPDRNSSRKVQS